MNDFKSVDPTRVLDLLKEHARPLSAALARRPALRERLLQEGALGQALDRVEISRLVRSAPAEEEDEASLLRRLRLAKEEVFVHLAARDLLGLADLSEVFAVLSDLAEEALAQALQMGTALLLAKKGLDPWPAGQPHFFTILALGKLGGRELNYASDVDLVYLHQPRLWPYAKRLAAPEAAAWMGAFISRALGEVTAEGLVFRVDLDLRPAGKDGAMAPSLEATRHHYLYRAADWERLALIKLRAVAGNLEAGQELSQETRPFVFRRHLDYTAIEELAALKAALASRPRSPTLAGQDLKLDAGGIRQLEFFVQTLQLIYGGRRQRLRAAPTLEALERLAEAKIISSEDRVELAAAYLFLRRAEHRLQLAGLAQTQTLPRRVAEMDKLGRAMGYGGPLPGRDFLDDLAVHTGHVSARFEGLLAGPPLHRDPRPLASLLESLEAGRDEEVKDILATAGFIEPEKAVNSLAKLTAESFLPQPLTRQRKLLAQILPVLLERVLASPDPDQALLRLERFLTRIGPKTGLYLLLLENPATAKLLVRIMASSAYLARVLTAHPGILDGLIDQRSLAIKEIPALRADLAEALAAAGGDEEEAAALIRRFKAEETVRIGVADLSGEMEVELVSGQLSDLAETILAATLDLAASLLGRRFQPAGSSGLALAVLALGKLGGRELAYHSDLDVLFLYQAPPGWRAIRTEGRSELQANEYSIKLAQRIISLLSVSMAEGPGYEIDARLRPSGGQGPLVVSLEAFARYHQTSALWERLALLKMRPVAGDEALGRAAMAATEAVFERGLDAGWVEEIQEMRARMGRERGAKTGWDIKFGPGGLVEAELAVQALQLGHGRLHPSLRTPQTLQAIKALQAAGLIDQEIYQDLWAGYDYLRNLDKRLRLLYDRSGEGVGCTEAEMVQAGASPQELDRVREGVGRAYRRVMTELLAGKGPTPG